MLTKQRIQEVKPFLRKHNYTAKVEKANENSCYLLLPDGSKTEYILDKNGLRVNGEYWSCQEHARRILVSCDIAKKMRKINMNFELVDYFDGDDKVDEISSILPDPSNEEEVKKENLLSYLLIQGIENKFPIEYEDIAESQDISTSYRLAKSFF